MRFIIFHDTPEFWAALGMVVLAIIGVAIYQWLRPPAVKKVAADGRYQQAMSVYIDNTPREDPSREDRQKALAVATEYLMGEHGIPAEEAGANLLLLVKEYDREQSYELRHEALAYEQAGAYELALDYFERAARLQEEHDPEDY